MSAIQDQLKRLGLEETRHWDQVSDNVQIYEIPNGPLIYIKNSNISPRESFWGLGKKEIDALQKAGRVWKAVLVNEVKKFGYIIESRALLSRLQSKNIAKDDNYKFYEGEQALSELRKVPYEEIKDAISAPFQGTINENQQPKPSFSFSERDFDACTGTHDDAQYLKKRFEELLAEVKSRIGPEFASFNSYVALPYERPIRGQRTPRYRNYMWLGLSHSYFERPQVGIQFQVTIHSAQSKRRPFEVDIWIDKRAPNARAIAKTNASAHSEELSNRLKSLRGYEVLLIDGYEFKKNVEELTDDDVREFVSHIDSSKTHVHIGRGLDRMEAVQRGEGILDYVIQTINELRPVYDLLLSAEEAAANSGWLLLRTKPAAGYPDQLREGGYYYCNTEVPNYTKLISGSWVLFDRREGAETQVFSKAKIAKVYIGAPPGMNTDRVTDEDRFALLEDYHDFAPPLQVSEKIRQLIERVPNYNLQHSIRPITQEVFDNIRQLAESGSPVPEQYTLTQLYEDTFLGDDFFELLIRTLERKHQVILYGPPGTGKTYISECFARYFAGNSTEIVQFHPSYAYEDFVEGLRPGPGRNELVIHDGILKRMLRNADRTGRKSLLIIDEMNRGKIDRVFGELIHSIERGKAQIALLYSGEKLNVPENFYLIGTMNSADRSIALVDFALRRRFAFISLKPNADILDKWLTKFPPNFNKTTLIEFFNRLNDQISNDERLGENFTIGHSYFMEKNLDPKLLKDIWDLNLHPLLEEYYFNRPEEIERLNDMFVETLKNLTKQ